MSRDSCNPAQPLNSVKVMQMKLYKFFFFLMFLFGNHVVYADASPAVLFRGSGASPDKVFKEGFRSLGVNENLYDHVMYSGRTDSVFVATSSDGVVSMRFVGLKFMDEELKLPNENRDKKYVSRLYLYKITPYPGIFDVNSSIDYYINTRKDDGYKSSKFLEYEHEYVAKGMLPGEQIDGAYAIDVSRLKGNPGDKNLKDLDYKQIGDFIDNPYYKPNANRQINPSPLPYFSSFTGRLGSPAACTTAHPDTDPETSQQPVILWAKCLFTYYSQAYFLMN